MKATAIPKKVACIASALALSLTMVPVVPMVGGADTQALAAEGGTDTPPVISVTAPFKVTFGSKENPYDINNPTNFMSTTSYFQNGGTLGLSVYEVECNAPANYSNNKTGGSVVVTTNDKTIDDASQKLFSVWDANASDTEAINFGYANNGASKLSIQDYSLNKLIAVPQGSTTNVNYRLNLGYNGLSNAKIDENAAQDYDSRVRQDLGTVKFTFGRCAPIGDETLTKAAINVGESVDNYQGTLLKDSTVFYLRDAATKQVYSLDQVKNSATQLSELNASGGKEKQSPYYDMYQQFIESDEGEDYECRTKWTVPEDAPLADSTKTGFVVGDTLTKEKESVYRLRILDTLYDYDTANNRKAGITFQFRNAYNKLLLNLPMYKSPQAAIDNGYLGCWIRAIMNPGAQYENESDCGTDTNEIWNTIPESMQSKIAQIGKQYSTTCEATDQSAAPSAMSALNNERLFMLSYAETFGNGNRYLLCGNIYTDDYAWLSYEGAVDGAGSPSKVEKPYKFYSGIGEIPEDSGSGVALEWYNKNIGLLSYDSQITVVNNGLMLRTRYPFVAGDNTGYGYGYVGGSGAGLMNLIPNEPRIIIDDTNFIGDYGRSLYPCFCF
ncbi:hypothetical protein [Adlercreutzia sp. ZJ154]|uniref:hypothetical protein n=1 Tax=Adlercreutzia sp. ZJ154 TaxID=2709790 RepID=UPI0013EB11CB|nr:hypothetical protein [Adlercreutzia sp. ZJ154]